MRSLASTLPLAALGLLLIAPVTARPAAASQAEVIATIQVHGNNATPEAEILEAAGVAVGDPFTPDVLATVRMRLRETGRFEGVDVLRRFASIADPSRIAVVIVVDEKPVRVEVPDVPADGPGTPPRIVKRSWLGSAMLLPVLAGEDGYGLTYGAIVAWPGTLGGESRLAVPLTWGGHKQAGIELERIVAGPQRIRLRAGASLERRRNPFFDEDDSRRRVWARVERATGLIRGGATIGWDRVSFGSFLDRFQSVGADVTFDTRIDPQLPRNAVVLRADWTRYRGETTPPFDVRGIDARGYLGVFRDIVLAGRVDIERAGPGAPQPFAPLLGGWSSLRGFRAGAFSADTRALGTLELRVPLSRVLSSTQTGVSVFVDAGKAWDHDTPFEAAPLHVGRGATLWLAAPLVHAGLSVAHGRGSGFRVNVSLGLTYE